MYYISMLKSSLLDGGSTNLRLSSSAYDILVEDEYRGCIYKHIRESDVIGKEESENDYY